MVDSVHTSMTFRTFRQFIYGCCHSNKDNAHYNPIEKLISDSKVEVDFLQGGPVRQAN
jgi:hypothetical protein